MFREKVAKLTKVMFTGLTMALCVTAFNPAVAVKADILQESEPNGNPGAANQLPLNTWMQGTISDRYDEDWYKFTIEQPGETYFELGAAASNASSNAEWRINLYDADRHQLLNSYAHYGKSTKTGWMPGTYYVKISSNYNAYGKSGTYNLMVHNTPSDQWEKEQYYTKKNLSNANIVSLNKQYTGKLYTDADVDYYRFKLKGTNGVSFRFTIDDAVANPGKWRIDFIEYSSRKSLGYYYITTNETLTVPRCCGNLIVKISSPGYMSAKGDIYHIQATGKLGATEFTSLKGGTAKASLRWKKVTNATGYYIYRSTSRDSGYKKVATVTGKTSYTDKKSLKNGGYYYYKIVAFRKSGSKVIKSAATASNSTYIYKK